MADTTRTRTRVVRPVRRTVRPASRRVPAPCTPDLIGSVIQLTAVDGPDGERRCGNCGCPGVLSDGDEPDARGVWRHRGYRGCGL